jgi:transcriptional regulator with XRE-family HTH domain
MTELRLSRLRKQLTLFELSQKTGICCAYLSYYERGLKEPTTREKKKLARVLKTTIVELFPVADSETKKAK